MNRENIESVSYIIANDEDLKRTIHPCDVCGCNHICNDNRISWKKDDSGLKECIKRKVHFVLKVEPFYYK